MKMHASTDDNGVTRFMLEREDGSRLTFAAVVTEAILELHRDFDDYYDAGDFARHIPIGRNYSFEVAVQLINDPVMTAATPHQHDREARAIEG